MPKKKAKVECLVHELHVDGVTRKRGDVFETDRAEELVKTKRAVRVRAAKKTEKTDVADA